ncbi:MAG: hypothetical protein QM784_31335 [Polyangiaceae bacterium]
MTKLGRAALGSLSILLAVACGKSNDRPSSTPDNTGTVTGTVTGTGTGTAAGSASEAIAQSRCDRESRCNNVGADA